MLMKKKKKRKKKSRNKFLMLILVLLPFLYSLNTKNPPGTNVDGDLYPVQGDFIYDLTYVKDGKRIHEKNIFQREMDLIKEAQDFLILDLFLHNDEYDDKDAYPSQVAEMTQALVEKKKENPNMPILFVTDPINNFYGAYIQENLGLLEKAGIDLVVTDHMKMRDSNPIYSGLYRAYIQWFGTKGRGWISNPFASTGPKVNIRSILKLANFKGNHRKVVINEKEALVASANPHDPSAHHENVAMAFRGQAMKDLIDSELIFFPHAPGSIKNFKPEPVISSKDKLRIISEGEIYKALKTAICQARKGDSIDLAIFYISDFSILKELGRASDRGVNVRIIGDLNKDAFGIKKNGAPNRPALSELKENHPNIEIKFYKTSGEQFHSKMAYVNYQHQDPRAILGSANFTRRNLENFNLETDVELVMEEGSQINRDIKSYFHRIWSNEDASYTEDIIGHMENRILLRILWKVQEKTGLCTW